MSLGTILLLIVGLSVAVGLGRLTIPGHGLSYPGSYEAFAHIWVGALIVLAFRREVRVVAISALVLLTGLEIVMFMLR